jgi:2-polyprenyl-3-methyl-5-hydroxy-6-metoxy-1,4-benzoquinol methylase
MTDDKPLVTANVPCCVCGSVDSAEFFTTEFNKFNYSGVFHMRKCKACGLLFCSPRLTPEGIAALYDSNYYVFKKDDAAYFARTASVYARTLGMLTLKPGRVAEIGSGKGYLLAVLKALGWKTFGIEISPEAASYAERVFGVTTKAGTLDAYLEGSDVQEPFPVVLCIDIIEHVLDPAQFVAELARITAKGGYLIIDTPNANAAHIESEGANWRGFNPFHIYCFNCDNLARLLVAHGFEMVDAFTYNNTISRDPAKTPSGGLWRIGRWLGRRTFATNLEQCVADCRATRGYRSDPDSKEDLAAGLKGENLIGIARKIA